MKLSLGYSPCPNDTFIFYALAHHKLAPELHFEVELEDVEGLNQWAKSGKLDVSKISYHAYFHLTEDYVMLDAGGALGNGVGPLIVTKEKLNSLSGKRVAIPGGLTTANLLLRLSQPDDIIIETLRYDKIMPAVAAGEIDAGLIIHESRFTYPDYGLKKYLDVGEWWEESTGQLLPLGGIMAKRSLGKPLLDQINDALKASLDYSYENRAEAQPYIAAHSQEMSEDVMQKHIDLYVNTYSYDLGEKGKAAVRALYEHGRARGFLPEIKKGLFLEEI
ncbi:MAG: 1,4-dihydroxy-6-naphthoate synthase [Trueperaceae bacterium]|nr:1,4-dihydroxy-6-naphthoate synthase [Trueperaceae bacterium]